MKICFFFFLFCFICFSPLSPVLQSIILQAPTKSPPPPLAARKSVAASFHPLPHGSPPPNVRKPCHLGFSPVHAAPPPSTCTPVLHSSSFTSSATGGPLPPLVLGKFGLDSPNPNRFKRFGFGSNPVWVGLRPNFPNTSLHSPSAATATPSPVIRKPPLWCHAVTARKSRHDAIPIHRTSPAKTWLMTSWASAQCLQPCKSPPPPPPTTMHTSSWPPPALCHTGTQVPPRPTPTWHTTLPPTMPGAAIAQHDKPKTRTDNNNNHAPTMNHDHGRTGGGGGGRIGAAA
ncbi:hypothetical protein EDB85DRAFT_1893922 [Lactarius pseudohatsudake]|nr:hypothetical protein EDB85DRAFT_1893922 [Lactarius pseudohatsudake]